MNKYLVTGGTGFIGAACVRRLVERGHRVRVLDNQFRGSNRRLESVLDRIDLVEGDIRDAATVRQAVSGVDSVIHMAFVNGTRHFYEQPELVLDVGVRGMLNVLDACRVEGVRELVTASSSEVYQSPTVIPTPEDVPAVIPDVQNPRYSYAGGKLISELLTLTWGRSGFDRVLIFRPHNVYGPDMGWEHVIPELSMRMLDLSDAAGGATFDMPIQGDGTQTRAFVHIDDFTDGLMCVLDRGQHMNIYHLGTADEVSISELALRIGTVLGLRPTLVFSESPSGQTLRRCPDISKVRALGYSPGVGLDEGLQDTLAWYRAHRSLRPARS